MCFNNILMSNPNPKRLTSLVGGDLGRQMVVKILQVDLIVQSVFETRATVKKSGNYKNIDTKGIEGR